MREGAENDLQGHSLDAGEAGGILGSREDQLGNRTCYGTGNVEESPLDTNRVEP